MLTPRLPIPALDVSSWELPTSNKQTRTSDRVRCRQQPATVLSSSADRDNINSRTCETSPHLSPFSDFGPPKSPQEDRSLGEEKTRPTAPRGRQHGPVQHKEAWDQGIFTPSAQPSSQQALTRPSKPPPLKRTIPHPHSLGLKSLDQTPIYTAPQKAVTKPTNNSYY